MSHNLEGFFGCANIKNRKQLYTLRAGFLKGQGHLIAHFESAESAQNLCSNIEFTVKDTLSSIFQARLLTVTNAH